MNRRERRARGAHHAQGAPKKPQPQAIAAALRQADALLAQGRNAAAGRILQDVVAADPGNAPALFNLGVLHHQQGELEEAESLFRRALQKTPDDARTIMALACARMDKGDIAPALRLAKKAVAATPSPPLLVKRGILEREAGNLAAAEELFRQAIEKDPAFTGAYYALGAVARLDAGTFGKLAAINPEDPALSADDRIKLHFTLGKAWGDAGDDEKSFRHYAEGNRLKKATFKVFTIEKFESYVDGIIALFTEDTVKKHAGQGHPSARPVFIVGMPRSGSTLTDQILSSHPEAGGMGEVPYFQQSVPLFPNAEVPGYFGPHTPSVTAALMRSLSPETLQGVARKYLSLTEPFAKGARLVTDKMLFNFLWIGLIRLALPQAKIVHCTRDPAGMGLSIWRLLFTQPMPWAYDLADIGRYYKAYRKLMAHWDRLFPGAILEIRYEELVADQAAQSRPLLDFCGLPWDDRCLNFHQTERQVRTASATQVRQPIYGDSVQKWKKYEKYLSPLLETLSEKP